MSEVTLDYLDDAGSVASPERVLGVVALSGTAAADLSVGLPAIGGSGLREVWRAARPVERRGTVDGIRFARAGGLCFGMLRTRTAPGGAAAAAAAAYRSIFALIEREGCPHLLRVSNYLPDITRIEAGEERYRAFNVGRAIAFAARAREAARAPAACGLGCGGDALLVFFLAGDHPGRNIENPRQVSAFHYPERYGERAPLFARATVACGMLFISGTASIVGHESRHVGDVAAQADEMLRNLEALLSEARRLGCTLTPAELRAKVYLRHARDGEVVRERLRAAGLADPVTLLQAQICRPELDVEIEAHAPWRTTA